MTHREETLKLLKDLNRLKERGSFLSDEPGCNGETEDWMERMRALVAEIKAEDAKRL